MNHEHIDWLALMPLELQGVMEGLSHDVRQSVEVIFGHMGLELVTQLLNEDVTEVMVNPDGKIFIEDHVRGMYLYPMELDAQKRKGIVTTVAHLNQLSCTQEDPSVSGSLPPMNARFEGAIPPAVKEAHFCIRLPVRHVLPFRRYVESGALSKEQAAPLYEEFIRRKRNVLVAGGTGSGKTTFCNAMLDLLGQTKERVITIEDTQELQNNTPNAVAMQVNRQGKFRYINALQSSLRMRPDRIIVGELRDGESTEELLKAWNTGHGGGLATIHANSSRSSLPRVEQLLRELRPNPDRLVIAEAINVVVYLERYKDEVDKRTKRRIREVSLVHEELDERGNFMFTTYYHPSVTQAERR